MNLKKIWLIAKREFLTNFRRRSFLLMAFGMPILIGVIMVVVFTLVQQNLEDTSGYKAVGIVDQARVLIKEDGSPVFRLPAPFKIIDTPEQAAQQLRDKTIDGYYIIPSNFTSRGQVNAYYQQSFALNEGLGDKLNEAIKQALAARIGDPTLAKRIEDPIAKLDVYRLGSTAKLDESALIAAIFVPIIVGTLVFILTMSTSQFLMQGLVEEKENRMMELFITSARPSEMLWGKLLGLGTLGILQVLIWIAFGLGYTTLRGTFDLTQTLANLQLTPGYILLILVYTILGFMMFGSIMAGIGASVNAEQESRQLGGLISSIGAIPLMLSFVFFTDPNGGFATFMSLFPFTAPMSMLFRLAVTQVPTVQIVVSLGLMVVGVAVVMWLSAHIFRMGMLSYGKRLGLREIIRALREGRRSIVTTATTQEVAS